MPRYLVEIRETKTHSLVLTAHSRDEAEQTAFDQYLEGDERGFDVSEDNLECTVEQLEEKSYAR